MSPYGFLTVFSSGVTVSFSDTFSATLSVTFAIIFAVIFTMALPALAERQMPPAPHIKKSDSGEQCNGCGRSVGSLDGPDFVIRDLVVLVGCFFGNLERGLLTVIKGREVSTPQGVDGFFRNKKVRRAIVEFCSAVMNCGNT